MDIRDCATQYLFLLVGGNTLPNYVAAHLLADTDTALYLVYSEGTNDQRAALSKTLDPARYSIKDVLVNEANPANIYNEIRQRLKNIPETLSVGLHYTGGTKAMSVHAYRAIQDWQKEKPAARYACYTYLDARTLHLWAERSDWSGAQALFVGDKVKVSLVELLSLHRRDVLRKPMRTEAIWPSVVHALMRVNNKEELRKKWVTPWNDYKRFEEKHELKLQAALETVRTDQLHPDPQWYEYIYRALAQETGLDLPTTFGSIMQASPFAGIENPFYAMVKWFTGGWFEDYVFLQVQQLAERYNLHDLALNVQPKLGSKDFEFDVVAMRHYQLFAFSCTLDRGRPTCKHKLLEAVARARQLGGSEARIALVCCIDDPADLQNEVEMLVRDNQVKVFGAGDLSRLQSKIEEWFRELDRLNKP